MSAVSLILYKAFYDIKENCEKSSTCKECPYVDGCHRSGIPSPFPSSWNLDELTSKAVDRVFKG